MGLGPPPGIPIIGGRPLGRGGACGGRGGGAPPISKSVKVTSSATPVSSASAACRCSA